MTVTWPMMSISPKPLPRPMTRPCNCWNNELEPGIDSVCPMEEREANLGLPEMMDHPKELKEVLSQWISAPFAVDEGVCETKTLQWELMVKTLVRKIIIHPSETRVEEVWQEQPPQPLDQDRGNRKGGASTVETKHTWYGTAPSMWPLSPVWTRSRKQNNISDTQQGPLRNRRLRMIGIQKQLW